MNARKGMEGALAPLPPNSDWVTCPQCPIRIHIWALEDHVRYRHWFARDERHNDSSLTRGR